MRLRKYRYHAIAKPHRLAMAKRECVSTYFDLPRGPSKQSRFAKDEALLARYDDLFAVPENKDEACATKAACLFHVAEVDDTVTRGAKEGGAVQPALAVLEGAPYESRAVGEMDARIILAGFKNGNV